MLLNFIQFYLSPFISVAFVAIFSTMMRQKKLDDDVTDLTSTIH